MDRAGNFVVVWQSAAQDGDSTGIFGQRFNSGAEKLGVEFPINDYTTSTQREVSVAFEPDGGFVAVWSSFGEDGNDYAVAAQRFDRTGGHNGPEFVLNTSTTGAQLEPRIVASRFGPPDNLGGPRTATPSVSSAGGREFCRSRSTATTTGSARRT